MLAHLLNTLLIVALLACPTCCHAGMCCGLRDRDCGEASACCEARCPMCASHEEGESPAPSVPSPRGHSACQGICGGAVMEKAISPQAGAGSADWLPPNAVDLLDRMDVPASSEIPPQPSRIASGRFIRQLHKSLLC